MSLPGGTVEASRAKRVQRQQARYRDRGGIFKPADHNPLLDLLLSRGVNGESPSRANSPRRSPSRSPSPRRKLPTSRPPHVDSTDPNCGTNNRHRRNSNRKLIDPHSTIDHAHSEFSDTSAPGTSTAAKSVPRTTRASKPTNKSTHSKPSARAAPPPHSSDDESPPAARSKNSRPRDNTPKSSKEKPSKPKQPRKRNVPPQTSVTEHDAPTTTSRKKAQKNATSSKSRVAVVAKLTIAAERDGDTSPAPVRPRSKLNVQSAQYPGPDSEQPSIPKKSVKGKLKAISLGDEDPSSQVPSDGAPVKKPAKRAQTDNRANGQSDTNKGLTNVPETDARAFTSRETKKRKKPTAQPSTSGSLPSTDYHHLDSDSEKQLPQSRTPSPEPSTNEPARKRRKARQGADEKVTEEQEPQLQNRRPSRQLGNDDRAKETRKVSRSKAPPIPMPNGIRLKPKPRPRLSMFQPPPDDDDNDHDPIDFLS